MMIDFIYVLDSIKFHKESKVVEVFSGSFKIIEIGMRTEKLGALLG